MWSFPNVYSDEGRRGRGDGREICDVMVVFGDDILLFSDKCCAFGSGDLKICWARWYRRAIHKSVRQLAGAAAWLKARSQRVFLDARCTNPLPIDLPSQDRMRLHLIAVARGSSGAAQKHWDSIAKGSSNSLLIDTQLVDLDGHDKPFAVGWPLGKGQIVHVLDDMTLPLLLQELDTISDFVEYLRARERLLCESGCEFLIMGEEDLLAAYFSTANGAAGADRFPRFEAGAQVVMREGGWKKVAQSRMYRARQAANSISYLWDDVIEYQASHVLHGSTRSLGLSDAPPSSEILLRAMAAQNRKSRRRLGEAVADARIHAMRRRRFSRVICEAGKDLAFVFTSTPRSSEQTNEEYQDYRQYLLYLYCQAVMLRMRFVREIVGIGLEPLDSEIASADFMYLRLHDGFELTEAERAEIELHLRGENIFQSEYLAGMLFRDQEFPPG